jgi:hypothetical protein
VYAGAYVSIAIDTSLTLARTTAWQVGRLGKLARCFGRAKWLAHRCPLLLKITVLELSMVALLGGATRSQTYE